jgi:hypothetical protein
MIRKYILWAFFIICVVAYCASIYLESKPKKRKKRVKITTSKLEFQKLKKAKKTKVKM